MLKREELYKIVFVYVRGSLAGVINEQFDAVKVHRVNKCQKYFNMWELTIVTAV